MLSENKRIFASRDLWHMSCLRSLLFCRDCYIGKEGCPSGIIRKDKMMPEGQPSYMVLGVEQDLIVGFFSYLLWVQKIESVQQSILKTAGTFAVFFSQFPCDRKL